MEESVSDFSIRFKALADPDDVTAMMGCDIPISMRDRFPRGTRVAVFQIHGYGVSQNVAIPVHDRTGDEDAMINQGRARLHDMLSTLAAASEKWKQSPS
jgi:hypothetical protein